MDVLKGIIVHQPVLARAARGARIQAMCQDRRFATRTQVGFAVCLHCMSAMLKHFRTHAYTFVTLLNNLIFNTSKSMVGQIL